MQAYASTERLPLGNRLRAINRITPPSALFQSTKTDLVAGSISAAMS